MVSPELTVRNILHGGDTAYFQQPQRPESLQELSTFPETLAHPPNMTIVQDNPPGVA